MERTAQFDFDPIANFFVVTCNACGAEWTFETQGAYQTKGPDERDKQAEHEDAYDMKIKEREIDADIRDY
jgi:hypothetical protein